MRPEGCGGLLWDCRQTAAALVNRSHTSADALLMWRDRSLIFCCGGRVSHQSGDSCKEVRRVVQLCTSCGQWAAPPTCGASDMGGASDQWRCVQCDKSFNGPIPLEDHRKSNSRKCHRKMVERGNKSTAAYSKTQLSKKDVRRCKTCIDLHRLASLAAHRAAEMAHREADKAAHRAQERDKRKAELHRQQERDRQAREVLQKAPRERAELKAAGPEHEARQSMWSSLQNGMGGRGEEAPKRPRTEERALSDTDVYSQAEQSRQRPAVGSGQWLLERRRLAHQAATKQRPAFPLRRMCHRHCDEFGCTLDHPPSRKDDCLHFNKASGCWKGDKCRFRHPGSAADSSHPKGKGDNGSKGGTGKTGEQNWQRRQGWPGQHSRAGTERPSSRESSACREAPMRLRGARGNEQHDEQFQRWSTTTGSSSRAPVPAQDRGGGRPAARRHDNQHHPPPSVPRHALPQSGRQLSVPPPPARPGPHQRTLRQPAEAASVDYDEWAQRPSRDDDPGYWGPAAGDFGGY